MLQHLFDVGSRQNMTDMDSKRSFIIIVTGNGHAGVSALLNFLLHPTKVLQGEQIEQC